MKELETKEKTFKKIMKKL